MARARKFRGPEIVKEIEEAMDKGLGRFLINTQSKLSASSPILTGRLASSWFVGKGVPDRSVAPEMKEGSKPTVTPYSGKITLDSDWYISNSLPYAERAAYDHITVAGVAVIGLPELRTTCPRTLKRRWTST